MIKSDSGLHKWHRETKRIKGQDMIADLAVLLSNILLTYRKKVDPFVGLFCFLVQRLCTVPYWYLKPSAELARVMHPRVNCTFISQIKSIARNKSSHGMTFKKIYDEFKFCFNTSNIRVPEIVN